jgi:hypothetical protein
MRTPTFLAAIALISACDKTERCPGETADTGLPDCTEDFAGIVGETCDEAVDTSCMDANIAMSCADGMWTGAVIHPPGTGDCE